jgi:hypothetical protein
MSVPLGEVSMDAAVALGLSWQAIEAGLPKDWMVELVRYGATDGAINPLTGYPVQGRPHRYAAVAQPAWEPDGREIRAFGDTPNQALRRLAGMLR